MASKKVVKLRLKIGEGGKETGYPGSNQRSDAQGLRDQGIKFIWA